LELAKKNIFMRKKISNIRNNSILLSYFLLFVGVISIGLSAIFVKFANQPGTVSAFYRFLFALIPLIPIQIKRGIKLENKKYLIIATIGGIFFSIDLILWNTSLILIPAATATLIANNAPIWVGLGSLIFFKRKLNRFYWIGLSLSIIGIIITIGIHKILINDINIGVLLSFLAGLFYSGYLLSTEKARKKIDTFTFMTLTVSVGVIISFIANIFFGYKLTGFTTFEWLNLIGLGVISHFIGWISINYALGHLPASSVSVTLLGQIIITSLLAIPLLGENLNSHQIIGGIILLCGIYLVNSKMNEI
jgi:drug/metabolite transporter (DMT)-like permease